MAQGGQNPSHADRGHPRVRSLGGSPGSPATSETAPHPTQVPKVTMPMSPVEHTSRPGRKGN